MNRQTFLHNPGNRPRHRRGVLLLVVLSMLVLFLLLGTTFLVTSSQFRTASKVQEKANRTTFQPEDVLERAVMQLLRDTNNRHSALRYHSLLRDLYGGDGFVGRVLVPSSPTHLPEDQSPRFAGTLATDNNQLGTTGGQMVDLYLQDVENPTDRGTADVLEENNVVGLDFDEAGLPVEHGLSRNDAYYNGCLLTMLEGPCRGVSVRVLDYDHLSTEDNDYDNGTTTIGRLRVMAPRRADGKPLRFDGSTSVLSDFVASAGKGYRLMVNGRPLNGTGVGYNAFADSGSARLTSLEAVADAGTGEWYGIEHALTPNATYFYSSLVSYLDRSAGSDPFATGLTGPPSPTDPGLGTSFPRLWNRTDNAPLYPLYPGPGDTDESYDAVDFQNMFLAQQALRPRIRGRVVDASGDSLDPSAFYRANPTGFPERIDLKGVTIPSMHRPALANFWFHRLMNSAWLTSAVSDANARVLAILEPYDVNDRDGDGDRGEVNPGASGLTPAIAAQITAIKRKFSMRPLREDHPSFDGSNPPSRYASTSYWPSDMVPFINPSTNNISFPFWEAVGPWDVDNDGDGVPDSVWVDLGLPVQKTEDGRFYKPLVAMLVEDLDGRLNLNAHGSEEHFVNDSLDASDNLATGTANDWGANLAQDYNTGKSLFSSDQLAHGSGWGTPDISLRPVLSPDLPFLQPALSGSEEYDDYARVLFGRPGPDNANYLNAGRQVSPAVNVSVLWGRQGTTLKTGNRADASAGRNFDPADQTTTLTTREELVPFDFAGYPVLAGEAFSLSGFGERPDLFGRYATGLSPLGSAVHEAMVDGRYRPTRSLLDDSPFELDLSAGARRGAPEDFETIAASYSSSTPIDDDAPFSPVELERLLRATDGDADKLPSRLWDLVDAFDPEKLAVSQAIADGTIPDENHFDTFRPDSLQRVIAQSRAAINRRQVTTDSSSLPVPNENWTSRLLLGADGLPGVPLVDDDGDGQIDEGDEAGLGSYTPTDGDPTNDSDDYRVVMGTLPPGGARITDFLRYRVTLELLKQGQSVDVDPDPVNNIMFGATVDVANVRSTRHSYGGLLAPEVLAGRKMDLNRPFGDGRDNNGNGVVDEPQEAGEPWIDSNGNGLYDNSEPYLDLDGDGRFYADTSGDGLFFGNIAIDTNDDWHDFDGDGFEEPVIDSRWADLNGNNAPDDNEFMVFDHGNGQDVNGRGTYIDSDANGAYDTGEPRLRDDAHLARQRYARHLYCLMLTVMDENYLAPYDENDPQVLHYLDPTSRGSVANQIHDALDSNPPSGYSGNPTTDARRMAMRKLTCRQIAQWAINVVDMRDPDAIQTPFEYDENPWDGWNVVDQASGEIFPIDGDLATNENYRYVRDLSMDGINDPPTQVSTTPIPGYDQTMGVVWGAERPELLMTEGLAWHDRRLSDQALGQIEGDTGETESPVDQGTTQDDDDDLDQITSPQGSAFLELFNPWSMDGPLPRELYSRQELDSVAYNHSSKLHVPLTSYTATPGVALDRISNTTAVRRDPSRSGGAMQVDTDGARVRPDGSVTGLDIGAAASPVWRIACVEQHPDLRNTQEDNPWTVSQENSPWRYAETSAGTILGSPGADFLRLPSAYRTIARALNQPQISGFLGTPNVPPVILQPDPDWPEFDRFDRPTTTQNNGDASTRSVTIVYSTQSHKTDRIQLAKPISYIERAFYFIGAREIASSPPAGTAAIIRDPLRDRIQPGLLVPDLSYEVKASTAGDMIEELLNFDLDGELSEDLRVDRMSKGVAATHGIEIWGTLPGAGGLIGNGSSVNFAVHGNRFISLDRFDADGDGDSAESLPVAPVLPGRYAVIGSAGTIYRFDRTGAGGNLNQVDVTSAENVAGLANRYTTIVSRKLGETREDMGFLDDPTTSPDNEDWLRLRRIELIPDDDPDQHQCLVRFNGTLHNERSSEVFSYPDGQVSVDLSGKITPAAGNSAVNLTEIPFLPNTANPGVSIKPVVAIPMEGFNISEPVDGYLIRRAELVTPGKKPKIRMGRTAEVPEGEAQIAVGTGTTVSAGYDQPFDILSELLEDQTTNNYRTLHLQRLANPLFPWNPMPIRPGGDRVAEHDPSRPVNPYLTTDSLPLDLYAYNGSEETAGFRPSQRPFASKERGMSPSLVQSLFNDASLVARDLWRSYSQTANSTNVAAAAPVLGGPIADPHPDTTLFDAEAPGSSGRPPYDNALQHSLGFAGRGMKLIHTAFAQVGGVDAGRIDLNGDTLGSDLLGVPVIDSTSADSEDDVTPPAFHWPNRPFVSEMELLLAPLWGSSRMLTYYSTYNASLTDQPNQYDGTALRRSDGVAVSLSLISTADPEATNRERWRRMHTTFGHLPNFFATAAEPAQVVRKGSSDELVAYGAPHFYRLLDYVHVPSRFLKTDTLLQPETFGSQPVDPADPRVEFTTPFNRVDHYREPGRVNLNTVVGRGDIAEVKDRWSEVYDGVMHRRADGNAIDYNTGDLLALGHLGPAWRDVEVSRRGYVNTSGNLNYGPRELNSNFPTFFANPFRSPEGGFNVPLPQMQQGGVDTGLLRAHHFSPGIDDAWGTRGVDDTTVDKSGDLTADDNGNTDDANEAGSAGGDDILLSRPLDNAIPNSLTTTLNVAAAPTPLMSGASLEPSLDTERNPQLRYQPMTRLANLATTRSGVFAVWMTVGFFEVKPANEDATIWPRYMTDTDSNGTGDVFIDATLEDLFFRIYPDGYTLGKEINLETGENRRHRGFYLIDRTLPVAFKPGDDVNVERAILVRRRIE